LLVGLQLTTQTALRKSQNNRGSLLYYYQQLSIKQQVLHYVTVISRSGQTCCNEGYSCYATQQAYSEYGNGITENLGNLLWAEVLNRLNPKSGDSA